jgi:transcriptional regulator with XRE-family HTH domain
MTDSAVAIRAARKSRGITQGELAVRAGVDQARVSRSERSRENPRYDTVERLLAGAGHRLYSAPTTRDDAASAARHIRDSLDGNDRHLALRYLIQLNDDLLAENGLIRGVLAVTEPELTGQRIWDAAIAALVAWRLNEGNVPLPEWVSRPERKLNRARVLNVDPADPIPKREDVPDEFVKHGVLAWRDTFASV